MDYDSLLMVGVVVSFGLIHFIEVCSFWARVSGVIEGNKAMAYALQNGVYMLTRFFSMLMLPILGLIVDLKVSLQSYVLMVGCALFFAFITSSLAILYRGKLVSAFMEIVEKVKLGHSLLKEIFFFPGAFFSALPYCVRIPALRSCLKCKLFFLSACIFSVYSISLFLAFLGGLIFPDYRTSLSQLSGVLNAFATVLLTFYLEPKISIAIDSDNEPEVRIFELLLGRVCGVGFMSLWVFSWAVVLSL